MKRRILAAILALNLVVLSGCSAMLDRDYSSVTPHSTTPTADGDPSVIRVERYQELVNALMYLVSNGRETGSLRLYMDGEQVETLMERACLEVSQEDPLGAYAVDFITYGVEASVSCYEAEVDIAYRRTPEQIASIVTASGSTAVRGALKAALATFSREVVLRIANFRGDEDYIRSLLAEAFYGSPALAIDLPDADVSIYPDSGRQRIVEVELSYHLTTDELTRRSRETVDRAGELTAYLIGKRDEKLRSAAGQILAQGGYSPDNGSTAYHALLRGGADCRGLALAMALLCQELEIPAQVVMGTLDGQPHAWNIVQTETGYQHFDLTRQVLDDTAFRGDEEMLGWGYEWNMDKTPLCALREGRVAPDTGNPGPEAEE